MINCREIFKWLKVENKQGEAENKRGKVENKIAESRKINDQYPGKTYPELK